MPTVNELSPQIGQIVMARFEDLVIACRVLDAKSSYGRVRIKLEPVQGMGSQWVEVSRLVA